MQTLILMSALTKAPYRAKTAAVGINLLGKRFLQNSILSRDGPVKSTEIRQG